MRVILKKEVADLGSYGQTVNVARGYARNYLIPKGFAVEATPGNLKQVEAEQEAFMKKLAAQKADADKLAESLAGVEVAFTRKVSEEEKLFGSVNAHDIETALKDKGFDWVARKDIRLSEPIKQLGESTVEIRLHPEVTAEIKVIVLKEE